MDLSDFEPAHRSQTNIMVMLSGPSNSGKTLSALRLARGVRTYMMQVLGKDEVRVAVLDTERKRSAYYAGSPILGGYEEDGETPKFPFLIKEMADNFEPRNYINGITIARKNRVDILIIDSLTHAWAGKGGMLEMHDRIAEQKKNSYTAWGPVDKDYNALLDAIFQYPGHILVTVREKEAHELQPEPDAKGNVKMVPKKVGLEPIFRKGTRGSLTYEFPVAFKFDQENHHALVDKDITDVFDDVESGRPWQPQRLNEMHGHALAEWLYSPSGGAHSDGEATAAGNGFAPVTSEDVAVATVAEPEHDEPEVRPGRAVRNAVRNAKKHAGGETGDDLFD